MEEVLNDLISMVLLFMPTHDGVHAEKRSSRVVVLIVVGVPVVLIVLEVAVVVGVVVDVVIAVVVVVALDTGLYGNSVVIFWCSCDRACRTPVAQNIQQQYREQTLVILAFSTSM